VKPSHSYILSLPKNEVPVCLLPLYTSRDRGKIATNNAEDGGTREIPEVLPFDISADLKSMACFSPSSEEHLKPCLILELQQKSESSGVKS
jgi:hypothetical protein